MAFADDNQQRWPLHHVSALASSEFEVLSSSEILRMLLTLSCEILLELDINTLQQLLKNY